MEFLFALFISLHSRHIYKGNTCDEILCHTDGLIASAEYPFSKKRIRKPG
jgi:hypothetical protein